MAFDRNEAASELESLVAHGASDADLSQWALDTVNSAGERLGDQTYRLLLSLVALLEGPQFEMSRDEILEVAARLRGHVPE